MALGILTSFRTSEEMRDKLQAAAAANGVSMNAEINNRLAASFDPDRDVDQVFSSRAWFGVMKLVSTTMEIAGRFAVHLKGQPDEAATWFRDPYAFDQAIRAAIKTLDVCRPSGASKAPTLSDEALSFLARRVGEQQAELVISEIRNADPGSRGERLRRDLDPTTLENILRD